jgi:hypothetical protein
MNRIWIVCSTCGGRWPLDVELSTYVELDIVSRPCPSCEAFTLGCTRVDDSSPRRRHEQRIPLSGPQAMRVDAAELNIDGA